MNKYTKAPRHWHVVYAEFGSKIAPTPRDPVFAQYVWRTKREAEEIWRVAVSWRHDTVVGGPVPCYAVQCAARPEPEEEAA